MYPREYCWTNCSISIDFSPRYFFWSNTQVFILSCLYPFCSTSSPNPSFNTIYFFKSCRGRFISSFCYFFPISDKFLLSKLDHCFLVPIFFQVFGTCPIPSDNQTSFPSSDPSFILNSIQVSCSFYAPRSFTLLRLLLVQVLNKISDSSIAKMLAFSFTTYHDPSILISFPMLLQVIQLLVPTRCSSNFYSIFWSTFSSRYCSKLPFLIKTHFLRESFFWGSQFSETEYWLNFLVSVLASVLAQALAQVLAPIFIKILAPITTQILDQVVTQPELQPLKFHFCLLLYSS